MNLLLSLLSPSFAEPTWPDISQPISDISIDSSNDSALIIAIEDYTRIQDVPGALQNGKDWEQYFLRSANIPLSRVTFLKEDQAYKAKMLQEAKKLSQATPEGGRIWLVYIGHGANYNGSPIFVDVDARQTTDSFQLQLKQDELLNELKEEHDVIALIDACFSGRDSQGLAFLAGTQFAAPVSLKSIPQVTLLTAGAGNQYAGSLPSLGRPAFSYLALGALRGWGDQDNDGVVRLSEVHQYTRNVLDSLLEDRDQTPELRGSHDWAVSSGQEQGPNLYDFRKEASVASTQSRHPGSTAVVEGGEFSLDVVGEANRLAEQIARLEKTIEADLDSKEQEIRTRANRQWNNRDFLSLRSSNPKMAVETVEQFVEAYSEVVVKYPEEVSIPISVSLTRSLQIAEVKQARDWLRENGRADSLEGNGYKAILIPAGTFTMGCTAEQGSDCSAGGRSTPKVTITKNFYLMKSEVTQELYQSIMGSNPSSFKGSNRPVDNVSWLDAVRFANKLSALEGREECYQISGDDVQWRNKDCTGWRLPTEAEWEWAARGGQSTKYAGSNSLAAVGWYHGNSAYTTHDVCGKQKNGYGLCDMSGNVQEWVWDWLGDYSTENQSDPTGAPTGSYRVNRGGCWTDDPVFLRVSTRFGSSLTYRSRYRGFRLGRSP